MNTTVFLIRHGEIENPKNILYRGNIDLPLSSVGKRQIKTVAIGLKKSGHKIEKVYASPLKRAVSSAKIIAQAFGLRQIKKEKDLIDINIPALAGKSVSLRAKIHSQGKDEYSREFVKLGNEKRDHIVKRMKNVLAKIVEENKGRAVAVVSHGDPIRFLLFRLENPRKVVPSMHILANSDYPKKGEAVKLTFDENERFLEKKFLKFG